MPLINLTQNTFTDSILDRDYLDTRTSYTVVAGNTSQAILAGIIVQINYMYCVYTSDTDNGNRSIVFQVIDELLNVVWSLGSGFRQQQNRTIEYSFVPAVSRELGETQNTSVIAIPPNFVLPEGHTILAKDDNNISIGDNFTYAIGYNVLGITP